ncbi:MAG: hypothetical protein ACOZIN_00640 [Myxococcota bacterium]
MQPLLATVTLDPPTAMAVGILFALVSTRLIRKEPRREVARTAWLGTGWGVLYALCVGPMFFLYPDWMLTYAKDAATVSLVPAYLAFVATCAVSGAVGALAGSSCVERGWMTLALALGVGVLGLIAGIFWLQWDQYVHMGTYAEYHSRTAPRFSEVGRAQLWMNVAGAVSSLAGIGLVVWRLLQSRPSPLGRGMG